MKRSLVSLVTFTLILSLATPVLASPNYIRNRQARLDHRAQKRATIASHTGRHSVSYRRALYNSLVRGMTQALLAVTGPEEEHNTDPWKIDRPGTRVIDNWVGTDHSVTKK